MATITDIRPTPALTEPVAPSRLTRTWSSWWPPLLGLLLIAGVAELLVRGGVLGPRTPTISEIVTAAVELGGSADLWTASLVSGRILLQGLVIGTLVGVLAGSVIGGVPLLRRAVGPLVLALYATPFIALIPVLLIIFGFGTVGKTVIVSLLVFMTVTLQVAAGMENIDIVYFEVSDSFRTPWHRRWREVMLPAAAPYIIAGVRLGLGRALTGVVVAEFETRLTGLGGLIMTNALALKVAEATVPALLIAVVGISLTTLLRRAEKRFKVWKV
ncbi:ABC transporter permease [Euzebya pacifica]|uniref:ABC transporter permease n=1 Tax=Euzebya pacifica TaxID=1608957 RepID=UPI0030F7AFCF